MNRIEVWHPNGYRGILYGKSSYVVTDSEGREVFHTGFRVINTAEELYEDLETFPEFLKIFEKVHDDDSGEKDDDI